MIFKNNKKGDSILSDITSYFLFLFVVIVFWVIATFMIKSIDSDSITPKISSENNANNDLILFLNDMTRYDGKEMSVAELIMLSEFDNDARDHAGELAEKTFNEIYDEYWHITVKKGMKTIFIRGGNYIMKDDDFDKMMEQRISVSGEPYWFFDEIKSINTYIPSFKKGDINVSLSYKIGY